MALNRTTSVGYLTNLAGRLLVRELERHLAPGGYLFISHSESLNRITHGLRWTAPAVFRREPR